MGRVIINNRSDLSDIEAAQLVISVMASGRISRDGKQYCYLTSFKPNGRLSEYHVATELRKKN